MADTKINIQIMLLKQEVMMLKQEIDRLRNNDQAKKLWEKILNRMNDLAMGDWSSMAPGPCLDPLFPQSSVQTRDAGVQTGKDENLEQLSAQQRWMNKSTEEMFSANQYLEKENHDQRQMIADLKNQLSDFKLQFNHQASKMEELQAQYRLLDINRQQRIFVNQSLSQNYF